MMNCARTILAALAFFILASPSARSQTSNQVTTALGDASTSILCAALPGKAKLLCDALGVPAVHWVSNGVSLVIDRYFDTKDQALANQYGLTICYKDGKCIKPQS